MKKFCLLYILLIISVVSTTAQIRERFVTDSTQIRQRLADNFDMRSSVKVHVSLTEKQAEITPAFYKKAPAGNIKVEKTVLTAPTKTSLVAATSLRMKNSTALAAFTTGDSTIDGYILASCARYKIDPLLIYAQMNQESGFKSKATSYKGARGLMQLMPATAIRFGVTDIYDPEQNIEAGVKYLRWLMDKFGGDVRLALAGYNAGEGAVMKYGNQIPPYQETQDYVTRITARYNQIRKPNSAR